MPGQAGLRRLLPFLLLLLPSLAFAQSGDYLDELIQQARSMRLAESKTWHNLLHYRPGFERGSVYSQADSENFFNAADGKHNPQAELEATLAAFFSPIEESDSRQNPQCAFVARYSWLKSRLDFDPQRLPERECRRFERWYRAIDPAQITLIFPAAYLNNPSSMFGHTLLRVDMPQQDERTRLLSYAINYAAETAETNGVIFAVKGLTGGYPGYFSIMPYYEKVKEYSDLENRDIWEYQLNFSAAEIRRLLEHDWQLGPVRFDYYFFSENCSYQLLTLFDVARPGLELSEQFPAWAIPSDTVREVLKREGLLKKAVYRPSSHTLLQHRLHQLDEPEKRRALALSQGKLNPAHPSVAELPQKRRALVLEAAYDYLQYQFNTGEWERDTAARRSLDLLRARSRVPVQRSTPPLPRPPHRPDEGHETARLALYHGTLEGEAVSDLYLRPAYHDLMDADAGYQHGAQINFLDLQIRHYHEQHDTLLESFTLVDIVSLSPRSLFFDPISWRISAGGERIALPQGGGRPLVFSVRGGGGPSYRLGRQQIVSLMLEGTVLADDDLPSGYAPAIGPSLQWLWGNEATRWKFMLSSRWQAYRTTLVRDEVDHRLQANLALNKDLALRLSLRAYGDIDDTAEEATLGLHWYF